MTTLWRVVRGGFPEEVALNRDVKAGKRESVACRKNVTGRRNHPVPKPQGGGELGAFEEPKAGQGGWCGVRSLEDRIMPGPRGRARSLDLIPKAISREVT